MYHIVSLPISGLLPISENRYVFKNKRQMEKKDEGGVHMFVLVHGLGGTPGHMEYLAQRLQEEWRVSLQEKEDDLLILNAECNNTGWKWFSGIPNWWATSDGIDQGGERLAQEIIARVNLHCSRRRELCGRDQDGCVLPTKEITKLSVTESLWER